MGRLGWEIFRAGSLEIEPGLPLWEKGEGLQGRGLVSFLLRSSQRIEYNRARAAYGVMMGISNTLVFGEHQ